MRCQGAVRGRVEHDYQARRNRFYDGDGAVFIEIDLSPRPKSRYSCQKCNTSEFFILLVGEAVDNLGRMQRLEAYRKREYDIREEATPWSSAARLRWAAWP